MDHSCKDKNYDCDQILQICFRNNFSHDKIISLLRELNNQKEKEEIFCRNCKTSKESLCRNCKSNKDICHRKYKVREANKTHNFDKSLARTCNKRREMFRARSRRNSTLSNQEDFGKDFGQNFDMENVRNEIIPRVDPKDAFFKFSQDIKDVKCILNEIVTTLTKKQTNDRKTSKVFIFKDDEKMNEENKMTEEKLAKDILMERKVVEENEDDQHKKMNVEEILHAILDHIAQCKHSSVGNPEITKVNNEQATNTKYTRSSNPSPDKYRRHEIKDKCFDHPTHKPTIIKQNKQCTGFVPTLNAYDTNNQIAKCPPLRSPIDADSQNKAIKHALKVAGIPLNLSDYISKLTPPEFHDGLTNVYYYINNDTGNIISKPKGKMEIPRKSEIVIEQQISPKESDCEDNPSSSYSHIIVDINIQEVDKKCQKDDNDNVGETMSDNSSLIRVSPTFQKVSETLELERKSKLKNASENLKRSKETQLIETIRNVGTTEQLRGKSSKTNKPTEKVMHAQINEELNPIRLSDNLGSFKDFGEIERLGSIQISKTNEVLLELGQPMRNMKNARQAKKANVSDSTSDLMVDKSGSLNDNGQCIPEIHLNNYEEMKPGLLNHTQRSELKSNKVSIQKNDELTETQKPNSIRISKRGVVEPFKQSSKCLQLNCN